MRATYRTSPLSSPKGARRFDVGVLTNVNAVLPKTTSMAECKLPVDERPSSKPPVAEVRWLDENGDVRFEQDVTRAEAHRLAEFFTGLVESMR